LSGPRILVLQHHPLEHPGVMTDALTQAWARLDVVRLFEGAPCPHTMAGYDGLLVMGGPMGANDHLTDPDLVPWLGDERDLIERAITADLPTLGICLGSQLIAAVAGAEVYRGPVPEIGWHTITPARAAVSDTLFSDTAPFAALEWHNDVFPLPPGAVALASSANYPVQGFRLGRRVYGLLFHLEIDARMIDGWCEAFTAGAPLPPGDTAPDFAGANQRAVRLSRRIFLGSQ
jgi:GMP synthase-like glutamine amidotransferase